MPSMSLPFWRCAAAASFFGCGVGYSRCVLEDISLSVLERLLTIGTDGEKAMDPLRGAMTTETMHFV